MVIYQGANVCIMGDYEEDIEKGKKAHLNI